MHIPYTTECGRSLALLVSRNALARRISIRIHPSPDTLSLTLPRRISLERGLEFVQSREVWILSHLPKGEKILLEHGQIIPVLGKEYRIEAHQGRGITTLEEGKLNVYGSAEFTTRRMKDFLTARLLEYCSARATQMAQETGKKIQGIRITHAVSRWGSCSSKGIVSFHFLLVFAPPEILDYLIAHEVAHLTHMNHSPKFWELVRHLCPSMEVARKWLKQNGNALHRYSVS